jgi:hypothetical protein
VLLEPQTSSKKLLPNSLTTLTHGQQQHGERGNALDRHFSRFKLKLAQVQRLQMRVFCGVCGGQMYGTR